jgi:hypothetical protein
LKQNKKFEDKKKKLKHVIKLNWQKIIGEKKNKKSCLVLAFHTPTCEEAIEVEAPIVASSMNWWLSFLKPSKSSRRAFSLRKACANVRLLIWLWQPFLSFLFTPLSRDQCNNRKNTLLPFIIFFCVRSAFYYKKDPSILIFTRTGT